MAVNPRESRRPDAEFDSYQGALPVKKDLPRAGRKAFLHAVSMQTPSMHTLSLKRNHVSKNSRDVASSLGLADIDPTPASRTGDGLQRHDAGLRFLELVS